MKGKTCCVTGHRDLPQNEINKVKAALEHEIDAAVTDGFTCFMSGFADGADSILQSWCWKESRPIRYWS